MLTVLTGVSLSFLICFYSLHIYSIDFFPVDLLLYMFFDVYRSCVFLNYLIIF